MLVIFIIHRSMAHIYFNRPLAEQLFESTRVQRKKSLIFIPITGK